MLQKTLLLLLAFSITLFAKEFQLKSIEGDVYTFYLEKEELKIKEFPNKIIIMDFFSTTCPPCLQELPELTNLQENFHDSVQLIGIESALKKSDKKMQEFADKKGLNYPVFGLESVDELLGFVVNHIEWNGALPFKLMYNAKGKLSFQLYGAMSKSKLEETLQKL